MGPISCRELASPAPFRPVTRPSVGGPTWGPCAAAEAVGVLPPAGGQPAILLTNFGLLYAESVADQTTDGGTRETSPVDSAGDGVSDLAAADAATETPTDTANADAPLDAAALDGGAAPGRARYGLVCEESFGGKMPDRVVRHADGRILIAAFDGLHIGPNEASGLCGYDRASGSVAFAEVSEVVVSPQDPRLVWAITRKPAALHRSQDGGASFTQLMSFAADLRLDRLFVTPTTMILAGSAPGAPLVILRSADGGATWATKRFASEAWGRVGAVTVVDGIPPGETAMPGAPSEVPPLFVAVGAARGADEIWRSQDGGESFAKVLTLRGTEYRSGFAFVAEGVVAVAGTEIAPGNDIAVAHLYLSRDGGRSFPTVRASRGADSGRPRYRCLAASGGRLYACGGVGDAWLFGVSDDEGATFTPFATITDIVGAKGCTRGRCLGTSLWLCNSYGICPPDLPPVEPPEQGDARSADVGDVDGARAPIRDDASGCSCRLGPGGAGGSAGFVVAFALVGALARRRVRRRCT